MAEELEENGAVSAGGLANVHTLFSRKGSSEPPSGSRTLWSPSRHKTPLLRPTSALCHCARFPDSAILSEDGTIIFHHITQPFFFSGVASPIFMVFLPRGKSRQHRP